MKERITFIHSSESDRDARSLTVSKTSVQIKALKASREERLTLSAHELPQEIWQALQQCHQLHLKWVSDLPYHPPPPFVSRAAPGLHLFLTPHLDRSPDVLRPLLRKVFGYGKSFDFGQNVLFEIPTNQSHHPSPPIYHYHDFLPSLRDFVIYLQKKICLDQDDECSTAAKRLANAAYVDMDYDAASREYIITSFHHESPDLEGWNEEIKCRRNSEKTEVGLFTYRQALEPQELSFEGYLTVIGEDKKPRPTRFSSPSRHHPVPLASGSGFLTTLPKPTGLHPTLRLTFPHPISPPGHGCALHTYLTLPSSLFVDEYQLSSPNFLAANNLRGVRALSGETDLEAPAWVTRKWGSTMLLELAHRDRRQARLETAESQWRVDIPLHLRYLPPAAGGATGVDLPWPIVFWACPAEEGSDVSGNPFDRINLGYEVLFGPSTTFYHFRPQPKEPRRSLVEQLQVPVMDLPASRWVESGTVGVIILGALWVMWKLLRVSLNDWRSSKKTIPPRKVL
ncbi:protease B nonderepressible form [Xanthoria calcicola]